VRIAPNTGPWNQWIEEAGVIAAAWQVFDEKRQRQAAKASHEPQEILTAVIDATGTVKLPAWDYQKRLNDLFAAQPLYEKRAPNWPELEKLNEAGYFTKTKAEAEPWSKPAAKLVDQLPEALGEAGKSQGASTGMESTRTESLKPPLSSTHAGDAGTRLRPAAARARSQLNLAQLSAAEDLQMEAGNQHAEN